MHTTIHNSLVAEAKYESTITSIGYDATISKTIATLSDGLFSLTLYDRLSMDTQAAKNKSFYIQVIIIYVKQKQLGAVKGRCQGK